MSTAASTGASGSIDLALAGAAVVVTGAGSGMGAATARLLGAPGASVTLAGRRQALLKSQVPLGRIGDPADLARWIALLLSPVSSFLTGVVLPVDGGR
jgi:NAD(P)-dependent dehydrogenase (short-subunit alcohol dehydrogenase family)